MALFGRKDDGVALDARFHGAGERFLESDLDPVEEGAGPTEGEQPAGHVRVVANEVRRHRRHP